MQLYQAETDTKYRVFFNELETNNLEKIMGDDISIRNVQLCAYLEDTLPKGVLLSDDVSSNKSASIK